ncbi:NAD(P)-dependent oxidoreductase [Tessaracoccus sp. OS52]|uniref:NAD-dependent epimerase/dehydratase family protein n=1 Tax=Tessaracoccus sp. OS52 TaxID=2886691 RepID=UPI001D11D7A6|nr:NAD(P)-dependent oxidoreductase [Tessaracoccus sp. OS52]MCC2592686.1 NAD(P)-dependent oxidoreductase [Tessaracoccus sp. OS52]
MPNKRRVLITGATGGIGLLLVERLAGDYELIQHGRTPANEEQERVLRKADVTRLDDIVPLMEGVDTVCHLAGAASPESDWDDVLSANIIGTRNVLEAARLAGVRRVVYASSNHAMGMYDRLEQWPVYPHHLPRGDSLYGVSKGFGELLGRFYHDEHGLDFIALRIGWVTEDPLAADEDVLRAMWLSPDDTERVFRRSIEAEVRFGLYYAVSDNPNRRWDLTNTMLELGYRPEDSWSDLPGAEEHVVEGGAGVPDSWPEGS